LDGGPHTLVVVEQTARATAHGTELSPAGTPPVRVRGSLQPSSATEDRTQGVRELTTRRWISRTFPVVSAYARMVSVGADFHGVLWELDGPPQFYGTGRRTRHWELQLRKVRQLTDAEVAAMTGDEEVTDGGEPGP
jgi:hypothetical protein